MLPLPFDAIVLDLLFELTTWHSLAKLRLHTERTLDYLDTSTTHLGWFLRKFSCETKKVYLTKELPSEEAAHGHRHAAKVAKVATGSIPTGDQAATANPNPKGKEKVDQMKLRYLNLSTYKLHALGDYVQSIRQFGTTDNYTTQVVSKPPQ